MSTRENIRLIARSPLPRKLFWHFNGAQRINREDAGTNPNKVTNPAFETLGAFLWLRRA